MKRPSSLRAAPVTANRGAEAAFAIVNRGAAAALAIVNRGAEAALAIVWLAGWLCASAGCHDDPLDVQRRYATTCRLTGSAGVPPNKVKLTRAASTNDVLQPVQMVPANDGSGRVFVVGKQATIHVLDRLAMDQQARLWLDLKDRVDFASAEAGLLSMALHPSFTRTGWIYVNYTRRTNGKLQTVISRFTVAAPASGAPNKASERVILVIDQPYENHNGGQIAFGPDGYLYIGMGDGGDGGDPLHYGQNLKVLLAKMLRIDINVPDNVPYRVPPDNPFLSAADQAAGTRPEIWAYGLRNPWRFTFDTVDGQLWAGDVGQNAEEEIDIITRGGNYGWRITEGNLCYDPADCSWEGITRPVFSYGRSDGKSVSGGQVYRGKALPGLYGSYVFADYEAGTIWALTRGAQGTYTRVTLVEGAGYIAAINADADGELYAVDIARSTLWRLEPTTPDAVGTPGWPAKLSQTGCFQDLQRRALVDGALPYSVNAPLWADGADKERALVLPQGGTIGIPKSPAEGGDPEGRWQLPVGTVLIKSFVLQGRPLETRFLVQDADAWRGVTYRWNAEGSDADLLLDGATEVIAGQLWHFPSRSECQTCHTRSSGQVLGLTTPQMNRSHDLLGTGVVPQIDALARLGYFSTAPAPQAQLAAFPPGDDGDAAPQDLTRRAAAYLHANCAHCHRPGGLASATLDLRASTPLAQQAACDVAPQQGDLGVMNARQIAPGAPERSVIYLRMATTDKIFRMPNLGTSVPDAVGTALVRDWIRGLSGCAPGP